MDAVGLKTVLGSQALLGTSGGFGTGFTSGSFGLPWKTSKGFNIFNIFNLQHGNLHIMASHGIPADPLTQGLGGASCEWHQHRSKKKLTLRTAWRKYNDYNTL